MSLLFDAPADSTDWDAVAWGAVVEQQIRTAGLPPGWTLYRDGWEIELESPGVERLDLRPWTSRYHPGFIEVWVSNAEHHYVKGDPADDGAEVAAMAWDIHRQVCAPCLIHRGADDRLTEMIYRETARDRRYR